MVVAIVLHWNAKQQHQINNQNSRMNSLRARQLLSTLIVVIVGILMLGFAMTKYKESEALDARWKQLQDISEDLLGYFLFERGRFDIESDNKESLKEFLNARGFNFNGNEAKLAYIEHVSTKEIHWHSFEPLEPKNVINKTPSLLTRFDIEVADLDNDYTGKLKPSITFDHDNLDRRENHSNYTVYAINFLHKPFGKYRIVVASNMQAHEDSINKQNKLLIILFFVSILLVIITQMALSFWVVAPIQDFEQEIKDIEANKQDFIAENYPDELTPIKNTINALLHQEKGQKQRYQDALDDLAHSLKTPLAALQGYILQEQQSSTANTERLGGMTKQLEHMNEIIAYQLRRAVIQQHGSMLPPQPISPVITRVADSLHKVYRDKNINYVINLEDHHTCRISYDDMLELFGNLINNASRFCETTVASSAHFEDDRIIVDIDDDGMGFPENNPSTLLKRGIRADSKSEGQGIGLAVCTEIVSAAGGKIELLTSPAPYLGARVRVHLPV